MAFGFCFPRYYNIISSVVTHIHVEVQPPFHFECNSELLIWIFFVFKFLSFFCDNIASSFLDNVCLFLLSLHSNIGVLKHRSHENKQHFYACIATVH